jgi:DNA-binding MarR family transcriptional regulator
VAPRTIEVVTALDIQTVEPLQRHRIRTFLLLMRYSLDLSNVVDRVAGVGSSGNNEAQVLLALYRFGSRSRRDLIELSGMSRSGVAQLLERLSHLGLVENFTEQRDHRMVGTRLTSSGRRRVDRMIEEVGRYFHEPNPVIAELLDLLPPAGSLPTTSTAPLDPLERVADLGVRMSEPLGAVIGPSDLRQRLAIAALADWGEARPTQLVAELGLTSGGATYLVDGLESAGLVERLYGTVPNDRRAVVIRLSPDGQLAAERFADVIFEHADALAEVLAAAHDIR